MACHVVLAPTLERYRSNEAIKQSTPTKTTSDFYQLQTTNRLLLFCIQILLQFVICFCLAVIHIKHRYTILCALKQVRLIFLSR